MKPITPAQLNGLRFYAAQSRPMPDGGCWAEHGVTRIVARALQKRGFLTRVGINWVITAAGRVFLAEQDVKAA